MKKIAILFGVYLILLMPTTAAASTNELYASFVAQVHALEERIEELRALLAAQNNTATVIAADSFTIYVDNVLVYSSNTIENADVANYTCSNYAFDTTYMWKQVRCDFEGKTIYNDIFVAG